jgi:hypothetical protein
MPLPFLGWLATAKEAHGTAQALGLPKLVNKLLQRREGVVKASGFEFYPDLATLSYSTGTLANRLVGVSSVSAIWVVGQDFFYSGTEVSVVKRLLLPDPKGHAINHALKTTNVAQTVEYIKHTTAAAQRASTKVKWYDDFIYHSVILADTDKPTGWMHVESVLPYSRWDKRPSWTVHKSRSEDAVMEMARIFEEIWDNAKTPVLEP